MTDAESRAAAEKTPDGHFLVIAGRRWRATDPHIPERLRAELVAELMAARRSVRAGEASARGRVHDAKLALGERGEPWWEPASQAGRRERLTAVMRTLLRHRKPESSICPSDAARVVGADAWRALLPHAREVAAQMQQAGVVTVTQRGTRVDPCTASGPVRIRRGPHWPDD